MSGKVALILALGFLFSAFVVWKNLQDDYDPEKILSLVSLLGIIGAICGYAISFHEWGAMFPMLGVLGWWSRKYKWNMGEWLDILVPQGLLVAALALPAWPLLAIYILVMVLKRYYRQLRWYKSGKPGLVGLAGLAGWGLTRIIIAFWDKGGVYLGSLSLDQWIGVLLLTVSTVTIYLRSGQKILWLSRKPTNR